VPTDLHGAISTGPKGNRVYFGFGTGANGIVQIVDREKLLNGPKEPTEANLLYPQITRVDLPPDAGAHTVLPLLGMLLPEFANQKLRQTGPAAAAAAAADHAHDEGVAASERTQARRNFIAAVGESTANECFENRQMVRMLDITTEAKPVATSTWTVPEASGNFCSRGGRFGPHSSSESFAPLFYRKLVFVSYFNGGVRAVDIRNPYAPREAGFYIPSTTERTASAA